MQYDEIISYPRHWDSTKYPVVAHLEVVAENFREIERLIDDQTQAKVLGHDLADDNRIVIHVACRSEDVQHRLESRWA